jgi:ketosteroid isomerase-like protein
MKRMNLPVCCVVVGCVMTTVVIAYGLAADKPGDKDARQEIEKIITESATKLNKHDIEAGLKHFHPTHYTEYSHVPQKPLLGVKKEDLVAYCKFIFPALKVKITPPIDLKVHVKGDAAYATYRSTEQLGDEPSFTVRRTEIFVREQGVWYLIHAHRSILNGR